MEVSAERCNGKRKEGRKIPKTKIGSGKYVLLTVSVACIYLKILTCSWDHKFMDYVSVNIAVVSKSVPVV